MSVGKNSIRGGNGGIISGTSERNIRGSKDTDSFRKRDYWNEEILLGLYFVRGRKGFHVSSVEGGLSLYP